ncbi:MAG: hypothetical protein ACJ771_04495 [Chloroflexota bacterium]
MKASPFRTEILLLAWSAGFGFVVGTVYWFLTYESAGTALLIGFGAGSAVAALLMRRTVGEATAGGHGEEIAPRPSWGPFGIGAGVGAVGLGLAFGPWLILLGMVMLTASGVSWLATAVADYERLS